ncbi:hypothetical protein O0L34_g1300 [Tuta absoluta]|nr:hypothetical protein O0L34_g1300 [Tuta absoluta]
MNLSFEHSLYSFDLDFLHHETSNDVHSDVVINQNPIEQTTIVSESSDSAILSTTSFQLQKRRNPSRSVNYVKKKIIVTDTVVRQYNLRCEQVAQLEKKLLDVNDKCRDTCIERDKIRHNSDVLRKNCEVLLNKNGELERRILENQHIKAALESHSHQQQELIKEYESQIEGLKLEKVLTKATIKDLEKSVSFLTKNRDTITTHLHMMADILSSKRTMTRAEKLLVVKYMKQKMKSDAAKEIDKVAPEKQIGDSDAGDCEEFLSDTDGCASADSEKVLFSPPLPRKIQAIKKADLKKDDTDVDQDLTYEVTSIDTGRGSSLAFSDSDTPYSPDYYINSPASVFSVEDSKRKVKKTSVATSPIAWSKHLRETASSPIAITVDKTREKNAANIQYVDKATSPIQITVDEIDGYNSKASSPILITLEDIADIQPKPTSPIRITVEDIDGIEPLPTFELTSRENRRHLDSDKNTDSEVEMILNSMKLSGAPITPIPETPARTQRVVSRSPEKVDCILSSVVRITQALKVIANTNPDIKHLLPSLDTLKPFIKSPELRTLVNISEEPNASYSTSRVIDSPEPDISFEDTSITDGEDCVIINQQKHKNLKISRSIQFENERSTGECIRPNSPLISRPKTKISEKIQFDNDIDVFQSNSITNHDEHDSGNLQGHNKFSSSTNKDMKKISSAKKLTRLEKLRINLIPKCKIKRNATPPRKLCSNINMAPIRNKKINNVTSTATLNNKEVYEKAVRVMAELKSQQKTAAPTIRTRRQKSVNNISTHEEDTHKITSDKNSVNVTPTKQTEVQTDLENGDSFNKHKDLVCVTNETNAPDSSCEKTNQNNTPRSIKTSPRKQESPEIENILCKIRNKYPSISLEKDIVVVVTRSPEVAEKIRRRSEMDEEPNTEQRKITPRKLQFDTEKPNIVGAVEVAKPPKKLGRKRVPNDKFNNTAGNKRILRSDTRRSVDTEKNNNESNRYDKSTGEASTCELDLSEVSTPRPRRTSANKSESTTTSMSNLTTSSGSSINDLDSGGLLTPRQRRTCSNKQDTSVSITPKSTTSTSKLTTGSGSTINDLDSSGILTPRQRRTAAIKAYTSGINTLKSTTSLTTKPTTSSESTLNEFDSSGFLTRRLRRSSSNKLDTSVSMTPKSTTPSTSKPTTSPGSIIHDLNANELLTTRQRRTSSNKQDRSVSTTPKSTTSTSTPTTSSGSTDSSGLLTTRQRRTAANKSDTSGSITLESTTASTTKPTTSSESILNELDSSGVLTRRLRRSSSNKLDTKDSITPKSTITSNTTSTTSSESTLNEVDSSGVLTRRLRRSSSNKLDTGDSITPKSTITSNTTSTTSSESTLNEVDSSGVLTRRLRRSSSNKLDTGDSITPKSTITSNTTSTTSSESTLNEVDSSGFSTSRPRRASASKSDTIESITSKSTTSSTTKPDTTARITRKRSLEESSTENRVTYEDLDIFNESPSRENLENCNDLPVNNNPAPPKKPKFMQVDTNFILQPQESVLCKMIEAHGFNNMKKFPKKVPEATVAAINAKISESIDEIIKLPLKEAPGAMRKTVNELQKWKLKEFLAGLMAYLMDPTRRLELFNKLQFLSAPSMTKQEQVLLYIVTTAEWRDRDTPACVLTKIEHALFSLGRSPDLQVIESVSHFYAILCRRVRAKTRLRLFLLNAMYCMTYSAFALIKQCIEAWMHILPLAHMGIAKCPVVMCLVYLLHFYKSDDTKNKVQDIRNILKRKYFFQVTEWDETKILDMLKTSILELEKDNADEDALKLALLILAKRNGVKWCQSRLVQGTLQPLVADRGLPETPKAFCISMLGALYKPYPDNMKVRCEITINQLVEMLEKKPSPRLEEAIYTSLIRLSRHNPERVVQTLLMWRPKKLSPHMEKTLQDFVKEKPLRVWKAILRNISLVK